jgi:hypothetical protein
MHDSNEAKEALVNELLSVSRSLADWARTEMASGETVQGIKKRLREAAVAAGRA